MAKKAVEQFKKLINDIQIEQKDMNKTGQELPMTEIEPSQEQIDEIDRIDGLTEKEKTELRGVLNPPVNKKKIS